MRDKGQIDFFCDKPAQTYNINGPRGKKCNVRKCSIWMP